MKNILLVLSGIADEPIEALDRKTPLEIAKTPNANALAQAGTVGRLRLADSRTIPSEETTCLGVLGYETSGPRTARGPLSAAAISLKSTLDEWLLACRLVTVLDGKLVDPWAGGIGERESAALFEALNRAFKDRDMRVYTGDARCHVLAIRADEAYGKIGDLDLRGPDEMTGRELWGAWSKSGCGARLREALADVAEILEAHEVNKVRVDLNENPANMLWVWGAGKALHLEPFSGPGSTVVLSSSDIWRGAARAAGIEWAPAFKTAKPETADLAELAARMMGWVRSHDRVILHLDEADRAALSGEYKKKIRWIEGFDQYLIGTLRDRLGSSADGARIAVVSGHVTSCERKERTSAEAPFLIWGAGVEAGGQTEFNEEAASRAKAVNGGAEFLKKIS